MKELQIQVCKDQKTTTYNYILQTAVYAVFSFSCLKIIFSGFEAFASCQWIAIPVSILTGAVLLLIKKEKIRRYLLPLGLLFHLILLLIAFSYSRNGISVLVNDYLTFLTGKTGTLHLKFPVNGTDGVLYISILLGTFWAFITQELFYRNQRYLCCIIGLLCLLCCVIGLFKFDLTAVLLAASMLIMIFTEHFQSIHKKGMLGVIFSLGCIAFFCTFIAAAVLSLTKDDFSSAHIVRNIKETIHQARYDSGTNAMPEGNLRNLGYLEKSTEEALKISTETPQKFYLRGLTGEVYTGNAWETPSEDTLIESSDLFYWLHKDDLYGQTTIASAAKLSENVSDSQLTVSNVSACHSIQYLPYGLSDTTLLNPWQIGDHKADPSEDTQTYHYIPGSLPQWYSTYVFLSENSSKKEVADYLALEESYRKYVYENDLQLTNTVIGVFERLFGTADQERSLAEVLALVRETVNSELEYAENVSTPNGNRDFVKYTLEQSQKGYSVHYATAAALMLRYFGIPSRYVEGYYLSSEEASAYQPNEEIILTESHAHAWAEFYLDGVGWIPYEVTPGYIDEEELTAAAEAVSNGLGDGNGKSYHGSSLSYQPPKKQEERQKFTDLDSVFRFEVKHVISLLLILLLILLMVEFLRIWKRRRKLLRFLKEMETAGDRDAISGLFSYSMMLLEKCNITSEEVPAMELLNQKALFDSREPESTAREQMNAFTKNVILACKKSLNRTKKWKYHYILWLYH